MPRLQEAHTYGGVLTRPAAVVVATIVAIGSVAVLGWKARDAIERAEASQLDTGEIRVLRDEMRELGGRIDRLNERLSRLEGRVEVRSANGR